MQTFIHKQSRERRLPTPAWALDDRLLQQVIVAFMEQRVRVHNPNLPLPERLALAIAVVKKQRPQVQEALARFSDEFRTCTNPARRADLQIEIENRDTFLRTTERNGGADFVAAIVYLYYRAGKDSVGVATDLGLKSPMVRQILYRLSKCWDKLQKEKGRNPKVPAPSRAGNVPIEPAQAQCLAA